MDLNKLPLFAALTKHMTWLGQRQTVLAQNVANANTPGYRPRDVKRPDFSTLVARASASLAPRRTDAAHLGPPRASGPFKVEENKESNDVTLSGNAVSLDEELMKVSETVMEYNLSTTLYNKHLSMIRQALGRQR